MESLIIFPKEPAKNKRKNVETMVAYYTSLTRAKNKIKTYKRFAKEVWFGLI